MRPHRTISRRSFLARVSGASALALAGCATARPDGDPFDPQLDTPRSEGGRPGAGGSGGCTDGDSGRRHDAPGHGRSCRFGETRRRPPDRD